MCTPFNSLLTAKRDAKFYSAKYNTFWYVVKNNEGYFVKAHSDNTANTVCTYFSGEKWEDFSMLNTQLQNTYFAINVCIDTVLCNNYKNEVKQNFETILQNAKKDLLANKINSARLALLDLAMQTSKNSKFGNAVFIIARSLENTKEN